MSFTITCDTHQAVPCFQVSGSAANHLDSIARYIKAKALGRQGFVLNIRGVTTRPLAGKLFIHVLKYPPGSFRKIALVDLDENRAFCSLYEHLARTRGYQVCSFGDMDMANEWLLCGEAPPNVTRRRIDLIHGLALLRHSLNPMRLLHVTPASR